MWLLTMKTRFFNKISIFFPLSLCFFFSIFDTTRQKRDIEVYTKQMRHIFQCRVSSTVLYCMAFSMFSLFTFHSRDFFWFIFCTLLNPVRDQRKNRIITDKDRFLCSRKIILHVWLQEFFHFFKRKRKYSRCISRRDLKTFYAKFKGHPIWFFLHNGIHFSKDVDSCPFSNDWSSYEMLRIHRAPGRYFSCYFFIVTVTLSFDLGNDFNLMILLRTFSYRDLK